MFDSINDARLSVSALTDTLEGKAAFTGSEVFEIIVALRQVFDLADAVNEKDQVLSPDEITDIGDKGLMLIDKMVYELSSKKLDSEKQDVEQVALVIAQWVIAHNGALINIQSVVDGLAYLANEMNDKVAHSQLATFMGQVAQACTDVIKHDLDNSNSLRPWRILNINRGIVATRSHDLDVMTTAFSELIKAIPMDAPGFFKEGLTEMVRLNYPEPVRELMREYYDRTALPSVH